MIEDNDQHEQVRTVQLPYLLNNFKIYSKYMVDILQISLIMVLTMDSTNITNIVTKYAYNY
jgi:hypothetical protein